MKLDELISDGNCLAEIPDKCLGFRKQRIYETLESWEGGQYQGTRRYLARRSLRRTGPGLRRSSR